MHNLLLIIRWMFIFFISMGATTLFVLPILKMMEINQSLEIPMFFVISVLLIYPVHKYLVVF